MGLLNSLPQFDTFQKIMYSKNFFQFTSVFRYQSNLRNFTKEEGVIHFFQILM